MKEYGGHVEAVAVWSRLPVGMIQIAARRVQALVKLKYKHTCSMFGARVSLHVHGTGNGSPHSGVVTHAFVFPLILNADSLSSRGTRSSQEHGESSTLIYTVIIYGILFRIIWV